MKAPGCALVVLLGCAEVHESSGASASARQSANAAPSASASSSATHQAAAIATIPPQIASGSVLLLARAEAQTDLTVRMQVSAGILSELEGSRMRHAVPVLIAAASRKLDRDKRAAIVWSAFKEHADLLEAWDRACDAGRFVDGGRVLATLAAKAHDARSRAAVVFGACRLEERGLLHLAEVSLDWDVMVLAHAIHAHLEHEGALIEVERRALVLLAKGTGPPREPIAKKELPVREEPAPLPAEALDPLRERIRSGIALLDAGDTAGFVETLIHPLDRAGTIPEVARQLDASRRTAAFLAALKWTRDHPAADGGGDMATFYLPWSPREDAIQELRFQRHDGDWYLRI